MKAPLYLPSEQFPAAAWRLGMAALLLASFAHYSRRSVPASPAARARPAAPLPGRALLVGNGLEDGARRGDGAGAVLSEADKQSVLAEASAGLVGPVMSRLIADGEKSGALDLKLYGGMSMREIRDKALAVSAQADAQAEASRKAQYEAQGIDPASDTPQMMVPQALRLLQGGSDEEKGQGAQILVEVRFAREPAAEAAIPYLESMEKTRKPEFEFAELALKRIRFFKAKRDLGRSL